MTIEDLAGASQMHPTYLQQIEVKGRNLSWDKLAGIASGLEMTIPVLTAHAQDEAEGNRTTELPPSPGPPSR